MFTSFSECLSFIYGDVQNMVYKFSEDAGIRRRRDDIFFVEQPRIQLCNRQKVRILTHFVHDYVK